MSRPVNIYERNNRNAKVTGLISAIDAKIGEGAKTAPDVVARWLRTLDRKQWAELARDIAHVNPPTYRKGVSETVNQVIAHYDDRAAKLRAKQPRAVIGAAIGGPKA